MCESYHAELGNLMPPYGFTDINGQQWLAFRMPG